MDKITVDKIMACMASVKSFNDILGNLNKPVNPGLEYNMMKEEVLEYAQATDHVDDLEKERGQRDALADQFVIWLGTVFKHGWGERIFNDILTVCNSNMSKFCLTQEEAEESVLTYTKQGIATRWEYNEKYQLYVIFDMDGKARKGINYIPPQL